MTIFTTVYDGRPSDYEDYESAELDPFGESSGNQRWRNDGELCLEDHEGLVRNRVRIRPGLGSGHPVESGPLKISDKAANIGAESQAVSPQNPGQTHDSKCDEGLHEGAQRVLAANKPCVKERQTRHHNENQRGRGQNPSRIAAIDHHLP